MIDILELIRGLLRLNSVRIDHNIFSLHYRLTVVILVTFALIISSRKSFGDPIDCTSSTETLEKIVDNFCWFNSYIIVRKDPSIPYPGGYGRFTPVIVEGVQNFEELLGPHSKHPNLKPYFLHAYQWIEFILFAQAILFFLPHYLWQYCWEEGRVKALTAGFSVVSTKIEADKQRLREIVEYIKRSKLNHYEYAGKFVICEILNFANALAQFMIVMVTLGLEPDVLLRDFFTSESHVNPENPLNLVFPNLARCEVPLPTGAGRVLSLEFCVLPLNVFVTKIYIFLWFYLLGLSVASGLCLLYRFTVILLPPIRCFLLRRAGQGAAENCKSAIKNLGYGEWFLLSLVAKNMDPFTFKSLLTQYNDVMMVASRAAVSILTTDKIYDPYLGAVMRRKGVSDVMTDVS